MLVPVSHRHAHVARAPFSEGQPVHARGALHDGERACVLNLDAEQQLTAWVERPWIGSREVLSDRNAPDLRGAHLAAMAAAAGTEIGANARDEGVARSLHK